MITELPRLVPVPDDDPPAGLTADHPMRHVTRAVAFEPDGWTPERRDQVVALFDSLADEWTTRDVPGREKPVLDALDRGLAAADTAARDGGAIGGIGRRLAIDVGAAVGHYSAAVAERFDTALSVDISAEMLRRAPAAAALRVQADASRLPVPDGSVDALVLVNCFLFPNEVPRVVAPSGVIVWVNSRGADTPIHLTTEEVDQALPGNWDAVKSATGWGTWSVHWRS